MARPVPPTQPPSDRAVCVLPVAVLVAAWAGATPALALLAAAMITGVALAGGISRARPLAFGIPYLGLAAVALVWLRQPPVSGGANVIVLLLMVWASDIGAYMTGRAIGGPRLAPAFRRARPGRAPSAVWRLPRSTGLRLRWP